MELITVYAIGGVLYALMEILWRGWTHWTMILCGGLCFTLMYLISCLPMALLKKLVMCTAIITTVEFLTGCLVNLVLKWDVWDYSSVPGNILGQICPVYSLMWLGLSYPGMLLCRFLRRALYDQ